MKIDNYQDIPRFTPTGTYEINCGWGYLEAWLKEQIDDGLLDIDPDFQRAHVWTEEQQIAFVEYALRGGRSGRVLYFNCKGWNRGHREPGGYVLVDGKQRLNAVLRFLRNELPIFGTLRKDFKGVMRMHDADFRVNVNDLETREQVLKWYLEMNTGGTPHTDAEIDKVKAMLEKESG